MRFCRFSSALISLFFLLVPSHLAYSKPAQELQTQTTNKITQHGITWTFDRSYTFGRFVNGDYWVLGPVRVVSVSPSSVGSGQGFRNGSVINPLAPLTNVPEGYQVQYQGYDGRGWNYRDEMSVHFPATIQPSSTLVSTKSILSYPYPLDGEDNVDENGINRAYPIAYRSIDVAEGISQGTLLDVAVLTVLDRVPPRDAFRPPLVGSQKPIYRMSEINLNQLPRIARAALQPVPDLGPIARALEGPFTAWQKLPETAGGTSLRERISSVNSQIHYGRSVSHLVTIAMLSLALDYTNEEKLPVVIGLVQLGIDTYYATQADRDMLVSDGGYNVGYKPIVLFAGKMLNNRAMIHSNARYQDDAAYYGSYKDQIPAHGWQDSGSPYANDAMYQMDTRPDNNGIAKEVDFIPYCELGDLIFNRGYPGGEDPAFDKVWFYGAQVSQSFPGIALSIWVHGLQDAWNLSPSLVSGSDGQPTPNATLAYADAWAMANSWYAQEKQERIQDALAHCAQTHDWNSIYKNYTNDTYDFEDPEKWYPPPGHFLDNLQQFVRRFWDAHRSDYPPT